jgi:hypothetical protein
MNRGPNHPYSAAMNACTLCNAHLKTVPALGLYLVGHRGTIQYPLCHKCIKAVQKGLTPDQLHQLDQKLEKRATELGLTQTQ